MERYKQITHRKKHWCSKKITNEIFFLQTRCSLCERYHWQQRYILFFANGRNEYLIIHNLFRCTSILFRFVAKSQSVWNDLNHPPPAQSYKISVFLVPSPSCWCAGGAGRWTAWPLHCLWSKYFTPRVFTMQTITWRAHTHLIFKLLVPTKRVSVYSHRRVLAAKTRPTRLCSRLARYGSFGFVSSSVAWLPFPWNTQCGSFLFVLPLLLEIRHIRQGMYCFCSPFAT